MLQFLVSKIQRVFSDKLYKTILKGSSTAYISRGLGVVLAFGVQVYVARTLGDSEFGFYTWIIAIMNLLSIIGMAGMPTATLRFTSQYYKAGDENNLRRFFKTSTTTVIVASTITMIIASIVSYFFIPDLDDNLRIYLVLGFMILPFYGLMRLILDNLLAIKRVFWGSAPFDVFRQIFFILIFSTLLLFPEVAYKAFNPLLSYLFSVVIVLGMGVFLYFKFSEVKSVNSDEEQESRKAWLQAGFVMMLLSGFSIIFSNCDVFMVGLLMDEDHAGYYSAATKIANVILFGLFAVNAISAALISEQYKKGDMVELNRTVKMAVVNSFIFTTPIFLFVIFVGGFLLLIFGENFLSAKTSLWILAFSCFANTLFGSVGLMMTMTGRERAAAIIMGSCAVINVIMNYVLIPIFGMEGAAISTLVTIVLWRGIAAVLVYNQLGIDPTVLNLFHRYKS